MTVFIVCVAHHTVTSECRRKEHDLSDGCHHTQPTTYFLLHDPFAICSRGLGIDSHYCLRLLCDNKMWIAKRSQDVRKIVAMSSLLVPDLLASIMASSWVLWSKVVAKRL